MANGQLNLGKQSGGVLSVSFPDGATNTEVVLPENGNIVSIDGSVTDNAIARYDGTTGKLQDSGVVIDDNGNVGIGIIPSAWSSTIVNAVDIKSYTLYGGVTNSGGYATNSYYDTTWRYKTTGAVVNNCEVTTIGNTYWRNAPSGTARNTITWTQQMVLNSSGDLLLTSGTGALGYGTGAGGAVTQLTSKSTAVTLNKPTGQITMNNAALGAGASVNFILNNNLITGYDSVILSIGGSAIFSNYNFWCTFGSSGRTEIYVKNIGTSSLSDAIILRFAIIKGAVS